jgi:uncharacterized protein YabE (DUF348 family)
MNSKKLLRYRRKYSVQQRKQVRRLRLWSRHPFAVPVFTFLFLILVTGGAWYALSRHPKPPRTDAFVVIVSHDHIQQTVPSKEPTVGALLQKLNITLNEGDVVEPAKATPITQDAFRINIYRAVPVEIVDGQNRTFTFSAATTPRSIARQSGVTTFAEDAVTTQPVTNFVAQQAIGEQVVITRSKPVNLNLYGTPIATRTLATTVGDLLREKHIKLVQQDTVQPSLDTPITPGQQIAIVRNGTKVETVTEDIPAPVQTIQDSNLAYGTSAIRQQGAAGQQVITYQDVLQNNVVVGRNKIQAVVTKQPITEIVVQGTNLSGIKGDMALAGIAASDYQYADYIISHESGWCPTKAQGEHYCPATPDNPMTPNGYGLCQATPGYKMASAGSDWETNPVTQLKWCNGYAVGHYGSWYTAYNHWVNYHWW